ncbi:TonB-dependent receptor [Acidovorax delafieldii 2AN]|uniref:TonB-dependent receptor n=1 Tax=Acidovorax delafieldii 2AN TaxID=573060 RepID=C5TAJ8_ACIDE|nr:TonB-dependent receptor [Acidovorax delafieldii]EER58496.1 TonB-dependent receptor [Acidovorax delafieldii 2AN]
MIIHHRLGAEQRRPFPAALRPLCALLAAMPLAGLAQQEASLEAVTVKGSKAAIEPAGSSLVDAGALQSGRTASSDTASLLRNIPGVNLYGAGGVSSLPSVHGLADDRLRIQVDGMDLISACGNHMNPPLSYIDPTRVGSVRVFAGITPVSVGGDSIGATIQVDSPTPAFAAPGQGRLVQGEAGTFYRSNGHAKGANLSASYATEQLSLRYDGSTAQSDNYHAARAFKAPGSAASDKPGQWLPGDEVGSSSYKSRNHALGLALRGDAHLVELRIGLQDIPYQNYPNQRMDMTRNGSHQFNLRYQGQYDWGQLQARAYREKTRHSMNFGQDKQFWYGPTNNVPGMPMDTEGRTTGVQVKGDITLSARDTLRVGAEAQRYSLDDWWLPSGGGMAPDTFWNIRDGQRNRLDAYAEWEARWSPQWLSQIGLRGSRVRSNSGAVQGYNAGYASDANAFNARDRLRSDNNLDFTALARYSPGANASYEFGFAHKTRSPNLYERYTWSTGGMAMRMINLAGDGNGYVGNLDLKPEVANTFSATADWHDATGERWGMKLTPYISYVNDYIDARRCGGGSGAMAACSSANLAATEGFVYLQFANQDARLQGLDLSGFADLGKIDGWGQFTLSGMLSYVQGKNRTTGDHLYNTMPLHARLALTQRLGGWTGTAELLMVSAKSRVSAVRNEVPTAGYGLMNLRASYEWKQVRLDLGVDNLFDRFYNHPLGGAYVGQGRTMAGTAVPWGVSVPGMGRSLSAGLTVKF